MNNMPHPMMDIREDRRDRANAVCDAVEEFGSITVGTYTMAVGPIGLYHTGGHTHNSPELSVRDNRTGLLVAYSSTRADYEQSIYEFALDYMVP